MTLPALLGTLTGAAAIWLFRRTSDGAKIRAKVNQIQARLLEFWLFVDEPAAIAKSWRDLLSANAALLRLLLLPLAILTILTLPLYFWLDEKYGTSPLPVGKPTVITLQLDQPQDPHKPLPELRPPDGIAVEGPPVRVFSLRQVSWRIRPARPMTGKLTWVIGTRTIERRIAAGDPFSEFHWSVWFVGFSLVGAILAHYSRKAAATLSRN